MDDHEWHLFDVERELEVRRVHGKWQIRPVDRREEVEDLTDEEFEQLRAEGPNPKGLP
jgi:hypothetical protein